MLTNNSMSERKKMMAKTPVIKTKMAPYKGNLHISSYNLVLLPIRKLNDMNAIWSRCKIVSTRKVKSY